jgi:hypothetical protein
MDTLGVLHFGEDALKSSFKRQLNSAIILLTFIVILLAGMPAQAASIPTGQTFFISSSGTLGLFPDTPAGVLQVTGSIVIDTTPIIATNTVNYAAGTWYGKLSLKTPFSGSLKFSIAHKEGKNSPVIHGTQTLNVASPTSLVNVAVSTPAFSVPAYVDPQHMVVTDPKDPKFISPENNGKLLFMIDGGSLSINAGGSNSWIGAPYGSPIFPDGTVIPMLPEGKPDLTVPSVMSTWVDQKAGTYQVQFTIVNNSLTACPASIARYSVNGVMKDQAIQVSELEPTGGSNTKTFTTETIKLSGASDTVKVYADYPNKVDEENENNNTLETVITPSQDWLPKTDLIINEIHAEWINMPPTNGLYKVHFSVSNVSPTDAPPFHVGFKIDGAKKDEAFAVNGLKSAETKSYFFDTEVTMSSNMDTLQVIADVNNEVDEQYENNNDQTFVYNAMTGMPTSPNLSMVEMHEIWSDPNAQESTYKISFNIANSSLVNAGAFKVGFSVDGVRLPETIAVKGLTAGANYADTFTTVLSVSGELDTITVIADVDSQVNEQFKNDNSMTSIWNTKALPPPEVLAELINQGFASGKPMSVNLKGVVTEPMTLALENGKVSVQIDKGTVLKQADGQILKGISANPLPYVPAAPLGGIFTPAYEFTPSGARFDPPLTVTLKYDPALLPQGMTEKDLRVGYYNGANWEVLDSTVDTTAKTVTTRISHFSVYALTGNAAQATAPTAATTVTTPATGAATSIPTPAATVASATTAVPLTSSAVTSATLTGTPGDVVNVGTSWGLIAGIVVIVIIAVGVLFFVLKKIKSHKP